MNEDSSKKIQRLSNHQIHWLFQKVESFIVENNDIRLKEMDDSDWANLVETVVDFGDKVCRSDQFCIRMILLALDYLQYSKQNEAELEGLKI